MASTRAKVLLFACVNISLLLVRSGSWHAAALACLALNCCSIAWRALVAAEEDDLLEKGQDLADHAGVDALDSSSDSE